MRSIMASPCERDANGGTFDHENRIPMVWAN